MATVPGCANCRSSKTKVTLCRMLFSRDANILQCTPSPGAASCLRCVKRELSGCVIEHMAPQNQRLTEQKHSRSDHQLTDPTASPVMNERTASSYQVQQMPFRNTPSAPAHHSSTVNKQRQGSSRGPSDSSKSVGISDTRSKTGKTGNLRPSPAESTRATVVDTLKDVGRLSDPPVTEVPAYQEQSRHATLDRPKKTAAPRCLQEHALTRRR